MGLSGEKYRGTELTVRRAGEMESVVHQYKSVIGNHDPPFTDETLNGQDGIFTNKAHSAVKEIFGLKTDIPTIAAQNTQPIDNGVAPGCRTVASLLVNETTEQDLRDFFRNYAV